MSAPYVPRYPGLSDQADWQIVFTVPNTESASPNAKHWHALLRLFSWSILRQTELEERVAKLEANQAAPPLLILPDGPLAAAIPELLDAIDAAKRLSTP
jgi:hypothetical protein